MKDAYVGRLEERLQLVFYCSARDETGGSVLGNRERRRFVGSLHGLWQVLPMA